MILVISVVIHRNHLNRTRECCGKVLNRCIDGESEFFEYNKEKLPLLYSLIKYTWHKKHEETKSFVYGHLNHLNPSRMSDLLASWNVNKLEKYVV